MSRAPTRKSAAPRTRCLSVIIPCFNEEAVIDETHRRLTSALADIGMALEVLYVDDGSRDATAQRLAAIEATDARVRVLSLSTNFGHQAAVTAGLDHATGDAVVIIDADLQDPPEVIPAMLEQWRAGYDVVYGQRTHREGESAFKLVTAKWFYRMLNSLSDVDIPLDVGDFRLLDRQVVDALAGMRERDRFLRGMIAWLGFKQTAYPYSRDARFAGETKYPLKRMVRLALDGVLSFSLTPLRFVTYLGMVVVALDVVLIVYALVLRLFTAEWVSGWTLMFISMMFIGGVQLIVLGAIGEYVGRIYMEGKRRPLYSLRRSREAVAAPMRARGRTAR